MDYTKLEGTALPEALGDHADLWAKAFCQHARKLGLEIDEGWMIGWFANAIQHSIDVRRRINDVQAPNASTDPSGRCHAAPTDVWPAAAGWGIEAESPS